jgi:hypothetical protein
VLDSVRQLCKQSARQVNDTFSRSRQPMSGPIVRTGTTPNFWKNWDQVFGGKKGKKSAGVETKAATTKSAKSVTKASAKPATGKKAKKAAGKKK